MQVYDFEALLEGAFPFRILRYGHKLTFTRMLIQDGCRNGPHAPYYEHFQQKIQGGPSDLEGLQISGLLKAVISGKAWERSE